MYYYVLVVIYTSFLLYIIITDSYYRWRSSYNCYIDDNEVHLSHDQLLIHTDFNRQIVFLKTKWSPTNLQISLFGQIYWSSAYFCYWNLQNQTCRSKPAPYVRKDRPQKMYLHNRINVINQDHVLYILSEWFKSV